MGFLRWTFGLLIGFAFGYMLGRLYAPCPGEHIQSRLRQRMEEIKAESRGAAEETRRQMEARYEAAKRSGHSAQ